jgi:hypothetical protein
MNSRICPICCVHPPICCVHPPIWIKHGTADVHSYLLTTCAFHESRHIETHALLTGVKEFISVLSTVLPAFSEMRCRRCARYYAEHMWLSWKLARVRLYFSCGCQLKYADVWTGTTVWRFESKERRGEVCDYVTEYSICSLNKCESSYNWH